MKKGDVIEFDYDLHVQGQDALYDTTQRDHAEAEGVLEPGAYYTPMRYVLGAGRMIRGLEEALEKAEVGKEFVAELEPKDAYGERDPSRIETVAIKEFRKSDVEPKPGVVINWAGRRGTIRTVGGGRVRVDFNPPLAGKRLTYKITVRKVFSQPEDRIRGLILMNYPSSEGPSVSLEDGGKTAVVEMPESTKYDPNWTRAKFSCLASIREHTDVVAVRFVEVHALEHAPAEPEAGETTATEPTSQ